MFPLLAADDFFPDEIVFEDTETLPDAADFPADDLPVEPDFPVEEDFVVFADFPAAADFPVLLEDPDFTGFPELVAFAI